MPNNYFDVFDLTHDKHKDIFFRGNVAYVAFISSDVVCNEYCILFR